MRARWTPHSVGVQDSHWWTLNARSWGKAGSSQGKTTPGGVQELSLCLLHCQGSVFDPLLASDYSLSTSDQLHSLPLCCGRPRLCLGPHPQPRAPGSYIQIPTPSWLSHRHLRLETLQPNLPISSPTDSAQPTVSPYTAANSSSVLSGAKTENPAATLSSFLPHVTHIQSTSKSWCFKTYPESSPFSPLQSHHPGPATIISYLDSNSCHLSSLVPGLPSSSPSI